MLKVVAVIMALMVGLVAVGQFNQNGRQRAAESRPAAVALPAGTVMDRGEFRRAIEGRTAADVRVILGTPVRTSDFNSGSSMWWYDLNGTPWRVRDVVTGKLDQGVSLVVDAAGLVESVESSPF